MSSSNSPAVNESTLYGQIPNYVINRPYVSVNVSNTTFATSADFSTLQAGILGSVVQTFVALGYWATSS